MKALILAMLTAGSVFAQTSDWYEIISWEKVQAIVTNIEGSCVITTNVIPSDNGTGCSTCKGVREHGWAIYHERGQKCGEPWAEATEKWERAVVTERCTLSGYWRNEPFSYSRDHVLSDETKRWKLKQEWEPESP